MNSAQRIGLLVATLVVLVVAFVVLSPGDKSDSTSKETTTVPVLAQPSATNTTGGVSPTTSVPAPTPQAQPQFTVINVRGGKPVGGVRTITVTSGDRARIEVRSTDTSDEVHLHGYDIKRDLKAGGRVRFSFKADAEGIWEMELEGSATLIAKLKVEPG